MQLRATLLFVVLCMAGCATPAWYQAQQVTRTVITKLETPLAMEFCSALLSGAKRGCAVRMVNSETHLSTCVVVVGPGDGDAVAHEGGHCLGYDH